MPDRKYSASDVYRYGFNGKENDNEVKGEGNQQDYGMRVYDPRIGKFLSVDPLTSDYPHYTPYQFASNSPIIAIDVDGLESSNDKNPSVQPTGNWYRKQEGKNLSYRYVLDKDKEKTAFFNTKDWTLISLQELNRTVYGANGNTDIKLNENGTFQVTSPNSNVGTVNGHIKWTMSLKNGGNFDLKAVDYMQSKAVGDGSFWGAAMWLTGEKVTTTVIGKVSSKFIASKSANHSINEGGKLLLKESSTVVEKSGIEISKHAANRMVERGITQKMVEVGIRKGTKYLDPKNGTLNYILKNGFASGKDLLIGVSLQTGKVTTVMRGNNLIIKRFIPQ